MDVHSLSKRMMLLQMLRRRNLHNSCFTKEIVPGQYPLLNYLSGNPEATQQELATVLFVSPASVAQSTKRLQKAGLLEKESDPENLRKNRLRVTAAGQEAVGSVRQVVEALDQRIGNIGAGALLNFFLEEIGPLVYNQTVAQLQERLQQRMQELDIEFHEDEFQYWRRQAKARR